MIDSFLQLPTFLAAGVLVILVIAGATKGVIGVGMPIVAVPLLTALLPLPAAVALLAVPLVVTNVAQAMTGEPVRTVLRRLAPILLGMACGIAIGVHLLTTLDPLVLKPIAGAALIGLAALMLLAPRLTCPDRLERVASPAVGLAGGLLGGLAAQPGPLVFLYLLSRGITGVRFVQHSSLYVLVSSLALAVALGGSGAISLPGAAASALATLPVMAGMCLGARLRGHVPAAALRSLVLAVVALGGLNLLLAGVRGPIFPSVSEAASLPPAARPR